MDDVRQGIRALRRTCPLIRRMHDLAGDPPLRRNEAGLPGLARIVVGQQVSVASANAIWRRFAAIATPMTSATLLALSDEQWRAGGLSSPKIRTLRAVAEAIEAGLDLGALAAIEEGDARDRLRAVKGIGPWTADIYLMFCVGRADVFAAGDLALQAAAAHILHLDKRPGPVELAEIAERWRPWRAVAARVLWAYYAKLKSQTDAQPV